MGDCWEDVVKKCMMGRITPSLLLYAATELDPQPQLGPPALPRLHHPPHQQPQHQQAPPLTGLPQQPMLLGVDRSGGSGGAFGGMVAPPMAGPGQLGPGPLGLPMGLPHGGALHPGSGGGAAPHPPTDPQQLLHLQQHFLHYPQHQQQPQPAQQPPHLAPAAGADLAAAGGAHMAPHMLHMQPPPASGASALPQQPQQRLSATSRLGEPPGMDMPVRALRLVASGRPVVAIAIRVASVVLA